MLGTEKDAVTYSVIMPATDRPPTMDHCVQAVLHAADPPDEVIVVDEPAGMGPAGARNAGAMRATGSILVFVDSDVAVHEDAFTRIRAAFEEEPELAAVFGSYDDLPSIHGVVSTFRNMLHHYVHQSSGGVATTFWAGLGAVRREAFVAVDGFDDWRFRSPSVEDIELGLRLASAGGLIRLDPEIQGTHLKHWRLSSMLLTDLLYRGMPWTALMLDRGPKAARLNLRGSHGVAAAAFTLGLATTLLGRRRLAAPLAAAYFAINLRFYDLLLRRAGPGSAAAGVVLLVVHNAAALGSAPLGVMAFATDRLRRSGHRATRLVLH
nr:glycosyltransferase family 2 protein [Thermoleophilaceae bacterium]